MSVNSPTSIGRYEVLAEIGRGTMGVVYKAHDPKIDRVVAIKTILCLDLNRADQVEYRERFCEEARAAGRLSHPGIVAIFDAEPNPENGNPYIVMEYVEGKPLNKLLEDNEGRLPLATALGLAQEIAEALDFAHGRGVVHRDIKPENILVTCEGRVKIADFGIAHLDHGNLTVSGQMLGSPAYMSPEQLEGETPDARSDLFSLGVVLYTMLTGHRPFQGNTTATVCFKVANRDPLPVSAWNLDFPPELDELVGCAMAKDAAQRFQSGLEMARELERLREAYTTPASPLTGIMRIIGQEPSVAPEADPEAIVAQIPKMVLAQKEWHSFLIPAVVSGALRPQTAPPLTVPAVANKPSRAGPAFSSSRILFLGGVAGAVLLVALGLGIRAMSKHGIVNKPPSAMTVAKAHAPLQGTALGELNPSLEAKPLRSLNPAGQPLPDNARQDATSVQRHVSNQAALSIHRDLNRASQQDVPSPAGAITVHMVNLSALNITIEHSFREAQASVSVDNRPVYAEELRGEKKRRALVFSRTLGRKTGTIQLIPGQHNIVVRVQSVQDAYDASQSLIQGFFPGSENTLLVKCDTRKKKLDVSISQDK